MSTSPEPPKRNSGIQYFMHNLATSVIATLLATLLLQDISTIRISGINIWDAFKFLRGTYHMVPDAFYIAVISLPLLLFGIPLRKSLKTIKDKKRKNK